MAVLGKTNITELSLLNPLSISNGGTGATTADGALTNLGVKSYIKSISASGTNITYTLGNGTSQTLSNIQGAKGTVGKTGSQGATGFQGGVGAQGAGGFQGAKGPKGATGPGGFQGTVGGQGPQGAPGFQGAKGTKGAQGAGGFQGAKGTKGAQGPGGFQGTVGGQGPQGPGGFQGAKGTKGAQGAGGFQGAKGPKGAQGPGGFQGTVGGQGPQGPGGFQGAKGTKGKQGTQGTQGKQGKQGATGSCTGGYVAYNNPTKICGSNNTVSNSSVDCGIETHSYVNDSLTATTFNLSLQTNVITYITIYNAFNNRLKVTFTGCNYYLYDSFNIDTNKMAAFQCISLEGYVTLIPLSYTYSLGTTIGNNIYL